MADRPTTRILLIRHGEAVVAVDGVIGGPKTCTGLSELGRRQAEALADRLRRGTEPEVHALWTSALPRAAETAEIIRPALGLDVAVDVDLEERRPGEADGVAFADFDQHFGPWDPRADPHEPFAPGAESLSAFHHRAGAAVARVVAANEGRTVMIVCHGGVIDVAFRTLLDLPKLGQFDLWTLNTSITEIARDTAPDGPVRWRLIRYNDHSHLAAV